MTQIVEQILEEAMDILQERFFTAHKGADL